MRTTDVLVVLVTCPTRAVARRIATGLVSRRLAACVNVLPTVTSVFRWQGKVDRCQEVLLVIKTTSGRFEHLKRAIVSRHPYETPEIIALPLVRGYAPYLAWVDASVSVR